MAVSDSGNEVERCVLRGLDSSIWKREACSCKDRKSQCSEHIGDRHCLGWWILFKEFLNGGKKELITDDWIPVFCLLIKESIIDMGYEILLRMKVKALESFVYL